MRALILCLSSLAVGILATASLLGPKNYDECIIENMKGVTSDVAAHAIKRACYEKFRVYNKQGLARLRAINPNLAAYSDCEVVDWVAKTVGYTTDEASRFLDIEPGTCK